ncbi:MAG: hypothetical protein RLY49_219 [Candidatus Parcubacteria bacterium]
MEPNLFLTRIQRLHGLQDATLTFNKGDDSISSLRRLRNLGAKTSEQDTSSVSAVIQSGDWCGDKNRTISFWNLGLLDEATLRHIARDIESMKTSEHWASGLMTGRKKRQEDITAQLISEVLTESFVAEVEEWGASIEGHFAEINSLPAIEFAIRNKETCDTVVVVAVDGWSGRYSINGEWGDRRFTDAQGVRERIYSALTDALDQATAV